MFAHEFFRNAFLAGTFIATSGWGSSNVTLVKSPVISSLRLLSTTSCMRTILEAASTDRAEASTVAGKVLPGYSGTAICALVPTGMLGT